MVKKFIFSRGGLDMNKQLQTDNALTLDTIFTCLDVLSRANALVADQDKKLSEDIAKVIYTIMVACQLNEEPVRDIREKKKTDGKFYKASSGHEITDLLTGQVIYRSSCSQSGKEF